MSDLRADAPAEVRFLFQESQKRSAGALAISLGIHGAMFALAFWVAHAPVGARRRRRRRSTTSARRSSGSTCPARAAAAAAAATRRPSPSRRRAQGQGQDHCAGREAAGDGAAERKTAGNPVQNLTIPAQTLASADLAQAGAMEGIPTSDSLGLGTGGGAGTGRAPASVPGADRVLARDGAAAPAAAPIVRATASRRRVCSTK